MFRLLYEVPLVVLRTKVFMGMSRPVFNKSEREPAAEAMFTPPGPYPATLESRNGLAGS
jgi:hypothetical protein